MKKLIIPFFIFCCYTVSYSQQTQNYIREEWFGTWYGEIHVYNDSIYVRSYDMSLKIAPLDSAKYEWTLTYFVDTITDVRNYELIEIDKYKGHYLLDEKNSIELDMVFRNNCLYSMFEVDSMILVTSNELVNNEMLFKIVVTNYNNQIKSGGKGEIPIVNSFHITNYQYAVLKKKE